MSLHLITAPTDLPLTVLQVRKRLKIDSAAEDEYIEILINSLTGLIDAGDGVLGYALCQQTWEYRLAAFPYTCDGRIEIPLPPQISMTSVKYLDTTETEQTLTVTTDYVVIDQGEWPAILQPALGKVWPITAWNRPDAVRIRFVCGHASPSSIPPTITAWMVREIGKALQTRDSDLSPDYSEILRYRAIALPPQTDAVL